MEPSLRSPKISPAIYAGSSGVPAKTPSGRLTLFSAAERRFCEPLLRGFIQQCPDVEIDFVFGFSTDLHRRYLEELRSGGPSASLLWSSAMDLQMGLVLDGHAQPHGVLHTLRPQAAYRDLALATTCEPLFTLSRNPAPAGTPGEITDLIMKIQIACAGASPSRTSRATDWAFWPCYIGACKSQASTPFSMRSNAAHRVPPVPHPPW